MLCDNCRAVSLRLTPTHEEIGQLTGASRETVTRLFTEFATAGFAMSREGIGRAPKRTMDCIDCHNRPTHISTSRQTRPWTDR